MGVSLVTTVGTGSAAVKLKNVNVAVYTASTPSLPVYAAASLGYFAQNGLNVTLDYVASGSAAAAAEAAGSVDFFNTDTPIVLNLDNAGTKTKEIAGLYSRFPQALYCNSTVAATLPTPTGSNANAIFTALKGVSVGITAVGSLTWEVMEYGMVAANLPLNYIDLVSAGSSATAIAAFQSGSIQCLIAYEPMQHELASLNLGVDVLNWQAGQGPSLYKNFSFSSIGASDSYIKANPKIVEEFARSIYDADKYISNPKNAASVAKATLSFFPGFPVATLTSIISTEISKDLSAIVTPAQFANVETEAVAIGEITIKPSYKSVIYVPTITCVKGKRKLHRAGVLAVCPHGFKTK